MILKWNSHNLFLFGFGTFFYSFGALLFFNQSLMILGVMMLTISALTMVKIIPLLKYFFRPQMYSGVFWVFLGLVFLLFNLPFLGFLCKAYGLFKIIPELTDDIKNEIIEAFFVVFDYARIKFRLLMHWLFDIPVLGFFISYFIRNLVHNGDVLCQKSFSAHKTN